MANVLSQQQTTGKSNTLASIVAQLLLCVVDLAGIGILIIVVGAILFVAALVGIVLFILVVLLLSSLFLVFKGGCAILFHLLHIGKMSFANAYAQVTASTRYQVRVKPWLIAALKKLVLWLIPFLLKHLWQWASSSRSWSQPHRMFQALPA